MKFIEKYNPLFLIGAVMANQIAHTTFEIKWIYYESTFWIHNILVLVSFIFILIGIYGWISVKD